MEIIICPLKFYLSIETCSPKQVEFSNLKLESLEFQLRIEGEKYLKILVIFSEFEVGGPKIGKNECE